ncbi:hypothetical protein L1987_43797 [Smallanthus sonchifolius]|uniref:Uncharacterized protein n=1 Tax=Smallanthus sonchifolius TaxID=185202 RepID=A0ACB9GMH4_9ASTR|nr:hypothetical protein L1987_43797 [Smallanthus sonchifolius]
MYETTMLHLFINILNKFPFSLSLTHTHTRRQTYSCTNMTFMMSVQVHVSLPQSLKLKFFIFTLNNHPARRVSSSAISPPARSAASANRLSTNTSSFLQSTSSRRLSTLPLIDFISCIDFISLSICLYG